jgi:hypothetical protein
MKIFFRQSLSLFMMGVLLISGGMINGVRAEVVELPEFPDWSKPNGGMTQPAETERKAGPTTTPQPAEKGMPSSAVPQSGVPLKTIIVPAQTLVSISLDKNLSSKSSQVGEPVLATVVESVYLGPYLAVPAGSQISGNLSQVNGTHSKDGRGPYLVLKFDTLKRPQDAYVMDFHGSLVTYKAGLTGQEYAWRLPSPKEKNLVTMKGMLAGAASGAMINPIFGPFLGAGASLLQSVVRGSIARGGEVSLKAKETLSIAVDEAFQVPISENGTETVGTPQGEVKAPEIEVSQPAASPVNGETPLAPDRLR